MDPDLSLNEARRIAVVAQGFATRPTSLAAMIDRLGVVQIDSVNIVARSHYLPGWSRMGAYAADSLDDLVYTRRSVFEYWGHEASFLPVSLQPLFRWRMARAAEHAWAHVRAMKGRRAFLDRVLAIVGERGPIGAGDLEIGKAGRGGWWEWSEAKRALEWLFWSGRVATASRRGFERLYDLAERVLPADVLAQPTPKERDAKRALIERSARAIGIGTETDLRDYFRLKPDVAKLAIRELVDEGVLVPTRVESWPKLAYRHRDAEDDAIDPDRGALLSPFDNLIWARDRTERLFGMRYRLEIYTPAPKRVYGYYVLPFLLGDRLVARLDLKADRAEKTLRVIATHDEPGVDRARVDDALARELPQFATWLGLETVTGVRKRRAPGRTPSSRRSSRR